MAARALAPETAQRERSHRELALGEFLANPLAVFGACVVSFALAVALLAPVLAPEGFAEQDLSQRRMPPSWEHPLGTDELGRSVLNRLIWGARISMTAGIVSVGFGGIVGAALGMVSAYLGGRVDLVLMRLVDILLALPFFLWAIVVVSALGPSLASVIIAIGAWTIPSYARLARGQVLAMREQPFVDAARVVGCSDLAIMTRHILPNILAPLIVQACLSIDAAILAEASLSFLGLGVPLPNPSWGAMILGGRDYIRVAPHLTIVPGIAIVITVLGFNLLADGLRDAMDPKLRSQGQKGRA